MPPKGYRSITLPEDVYQKLLTIWNNNKEEYRVEKGIRSFSGFCTYYLSQALEREKRLET